jgi:hypothetical protein
MNIYCSVYLNPQIKYYTQVKNPNQQAFQQAHTQVQILKKFKDFVDMIPNVSHSAPSNQNWPLLSDED